MTVDKISQKQAKGFVEEIFKPFFVGSVSGCMATSVIQPIDTIKVNIQSLRETAGRNQVNLSPFAIAGDIINKNGVMGLYRGLDSALLRQVVYCGLRLGLFRIAQERIKSNENRVMTLMEKTLYSIGAGLIGSAVANPLDMALIRFQADNALSQSQKRNYRNVFDAIKQMNKQLKFIGMWRGSILTIMRAMAINSFTLVAYNQTKQRLQKYSNQARETVSNRLIASAIAGISASLGSLPFDNIKTKILKMRPNSQGDLPYKNMIDAFRKTIAREGITSLWVGLPTFYFRVAPHAMIAILAQDFIHDLIDNKKVQ